MFGRGNAMNLYPIALFLHVSGAIIYLFGIGTRLLVLTIQRGARRVEQVRALAPFIELSGPLSGIGLLLILVTGFYMAMTAWGLFTGWIVVTLISLVLVVPAGIAVMEPGRRAIDRLAREAPDGPLTEPLVRRIHDPVHVTALQTLTLVLLGIVFLMTNKPSLTISLIVMGVALALGLASGALKSWRRWPTRAVPAS